MQLTKSLEGTAKIEKGDLTNYPAQEICLEYYMLEVDSCNFDLERQKLYGIQVVKTERDYSKKTSTETELIPELSPNKEEVKEILKKLILNKVTPICLVNVLEDIVTQKSFNM